MWRFYWIVGDSHKVLYKPQIPTADFSRDTAFFPDEVVLSMIYPTKDIKNGPKKSI